MRAAWVVFRREIAATFNSPMAYVVAIGFMLLNTGLWILDFWAMDEVSLRGFFEWVSWTACFVVPAITMRSWAEEKKGGTYELLLTFPARSASLVVGKYLAALCFYMACLSGSLLLPLLLWTLSTESLRPDAGAMAAGYLGVVLAGSLLVALGLFISVLCRDQIEAFIATLVVVVALRLVGFAPVAGQVDAVVDGVGSFLRTSVSFSTPLGRFLRGLVALGDVLFFAAWTAVFLFLNGALLEGRMKPGSRLRNAAGVLLGIPLAVVVGSLLLDLTPRADLTADRVFTVSRAAGEILGTIPEDKPVVLKLYFSPRDEMPTALRTLERDVLEKLEEFQRHAKGRLQVDVVHLHADDAILRAIEEARAAAGAGKEDADGERGKVEEQLSKEGVLPFRIQSGGLTGTETKVVYAAMTLAHGAAKKEIIPQLLPGSVASLEQDIVTRVYRLVNDKRPVVGVLAPIQAVDIPPQQLQLLAQLGMPLDQIAREQDDYRYVQAILRQDDQYEVRRLRPTEESLPEGLDTLVVIRPAGLSDRMRWDIARFLHGGGSVVIASQGFDTGLQQDWQGGVSMSIRSEDTGLDPLLAPYGLSVPRKMVMSPDKVPLSYSAGPFGPVVTVDRHWIFKLDAASFDRSTSIANGVSGTIVLETASPVVVDEAKVAELKLAVEPVLRTSRGAWTREAPDGVMPSDLDDPRPGEGPITLAALVRGTFPAPAGERPPAAGSPEGLPDEPPAAIEAKPGSLFLLGTARPFHDELLVDPSGQVSWAGVLVKNTVDALALGEALLHLTVKEPTMRPIRDVSRGEVLLYKALMLGGAPALYLLVGFLRMAARRRLRARPFRPASAAAAGAAP